MKTDTWFFILSLVVCVEDNPSAGTAFIQMTYEWSSLVAQQVKGLASSLVGDGFDPWPGNFRMSWACLKKNYI